MLSGPSAAKRLSEYAGRTIHRRSMILANLVIDFHVRLCQHLVGTSSFASDGFIHALGSELGQVDGRLYEEFVDVYTKTAKPKMNGGDLTKVPIFFDFSVGDKDSAMYRALGGTKLYGLLRYMMGTLFL